MKTTAQKVRRKAKLLRLKHKAELLRQQAKDLRSNGDYGAATFATVLADVVEKEAGR